MHNLNGYILLYHFKRKAQRKRQKLILNHNVLFHISRFDRDYCLEVWARGALVLVWDVDEQLGVKGQGRSREVEYFRI